MKVLIVDDDELLVRKIVNGLDWGKLGVNSVFTANDTGQAKQILREYSIQLLVTDIEMPGGEGSGLGLIQWIREQQMDCKCIIISSHSSFSYAQQAIKLQSCQYLLKHFLHFSFS